MLYLTCTTITSVDLAHYGVSRAKDWVSVDCHTMLNFNVSILVNTKHGECKETNRSFLFVKARKLQFLVT